MKSIRRRTAALTAGAISALLLGAGIALLLLLRSAMTEQFDQALAARAVALQGAMCFDGTQVELDAIGKSGESAECYAVWLRSGEQWLPIAHSAAVNDDVWPPASVIPALGHAAAVSLADGRAGRGLLVDFTPEFEGDEDAHESTRRVPQLRMLLAVDRAPLDRTLATIAWGIAGVGALLEAACIGAAWWAVTRGLRPVARLGAQVGRLGPDSLHQRIEEAGLPIELLPMAQQLNAMLVRLQDGFDRERRFAIAASHELRTPIAELRMLLEVARRQERSHEAWDRTAATGLEVLDRAQGLCDALLALACAEASEASAKHAPACALREVLRAEAQRATRSARADDQWLRVEFDEPGADQPAASDSADALTARGALRDSAPARAVHDESDALAVRCDAHALQSILANLLENALRHGSVTATHPVLARAIRRQDRIHVEVSNRAPALAVTDTERIFEPFWRADQARASPGIGVGLALARALARAHGGDLTAHRGSDALIVLQLELPAA